MWLIEFIKSNYYLKNLLPLLVFVFCFGFIYITSVILLEKKNNNSKFVSFLNALVLTTFLYFITSLMESKLLIIMSLFFFMA